MRLLIVHLLDRTYADKIYQKIFRHHLLYSLDRPQHDLILTGLYQCDASLNPPQVPLSPCFSSRHHRAPIPRHSTLQIHDPLNPTRDRSRMHRYSRPGLGG
jgi:hypothetical protein